MAICNSELNDRDEKLLAVLARAVEQRPSEYKPQDVANVIAWLLEQKADINALDAEGQSPFDVAWMPRSESAKALLLASGAKPGKELRPPETKPASPVEAPEKEAPVTEPSEAKP